MNLTVSDDLFYLDPEFKSNFEKSYQFENLTKLRVHGVQLNI